MVIILTNRLRRVPSENSIRSVVRALIENRGIILRDALLIQDRLKTSNSRPVGSRPDRCSLPRRQRAKMRKQGPAPATTFDRMSHTESENRLGDRQGGLPRARPPWIWKRQAKARRLKASGVRFVLSFAAKHW
jgi:hypothetical protein